MHPAVEALLRGGGRCRKQGMNPPPPRNRVSAVTRVSKPSAWNREGTTSHGERGVRACPRPVLSEGPLLDLKATRLYATLLPLSPSLHTFAEFRVQRFLAFPVTEAIQYRDTRDFAIEGVVALYRANEWSSAEKPDLLHRALFGSHSLFTAWHGERLVGLGNATSDGHLVVYYPH